MSELIEESINPRNCSMVIEHNPHTWRFREERVFCKGLTAHSISDLIPENVTHYSDRMTIDEAANEIRDLYSAAVFSGSQRDSLQEDVKEVLRKLTW